MELLQPKNLFLRLNLEQTSNILYALEQRRQDIEEDSLPLYDALVKDICDQFHQQGIRFEKRDS